MERCCIWAVIGSSDANKYIFWINLGILDLDTEVPLLENRVCLIPQTAIAFIVYSPFRRLMITLLSYGLARRRFVTVRENRSMGKVDLMMLRKLLSPLFKQDLLQIRSCQISPA